MCEHEQECDEENHPARDHLRGHKESQPRKANLEGGVYMRLERRKMGKHIVRTRSCEGR